jgi:excisionase family DNA binding protein
MSPAPPIPDPYSALAEALGAVVRQAVHAALGEVSLATVNSDSMLDVPAAAGRIALSVTKTKRLIAAGELRSVLVGRRRLVPVSEIDAYIRRLQNSLGDRATPAPVRSETREVVHGLEPAAERRADSVGGWQ